MTDEVRLWILILIQIYVTISAFLLAAILGVLLAIEGSL